MYENMKLFENNFSITPLIFSLLPIPAKDKDKASGEAQPRPAQINNVAPRLNYPQNWHEIALSCLILSVPPASAVFYLPESST